ncbi:MAG: HRDC domain-containing protein [Saprospiraceae bacterium]|nr:HRDC domain-containing protein [Saprospiraceae bacterium]
MMKTNPSFTFIDTPEALRAFAEDNADIDWLAFDTEFVGEKRYQTLLCLIQVGTQNGDYIIDPLAIDDLWPFLNMLSDPSILVLTHAGENDYRLLEEQFGLIPKNLFDIQIAAGFCSYRYPISYSKIVEAELGDRVKKDYGVSNWEGRPIQPEQLSYALNDILYLPGLYKSLLKKLEETGRVDWVRQELQIWESAEYYQRDPDKEILGNNLISKLRPKQQIFLIRLLRWRDEVAREKNYSKEMVFSSKNMGNLIRAIPSGKKGLDNNRRLSDSVIKRHGDRFVDFYEREATPEELGLIARLPDGPSENEEYELILDMLYLMVKYRCLKEGISVQLVFPRGELNNMKSDPGYHSELLNTDWRKQFLGAEVLEWIQERERLEINFGEGRIELSLRD